MDILIEKKEQTDFEEKIKEFQYFLENELETSRQSIMQGTILAIDLVSEVFIERKISHHITKESIYESARLAAKISETICLSLILEIDLKEID